MNVKAMLKCFAYNSNAPSNYFIEIIYFNLILYFKCISFFSKYATIMDLYIINIIRKFIFISGA
jgi:hypothetical protein